MSAAVRVPSTARRIRRARRRVHVLARRHERAVVGERLAVARQHDGDVHRRRRAHRGEVLDERPARLPRRDLDRVAVVDRHVRDRVRGDLLEQMVAADEQPVRVGEDRVGRAVAGTLVGGERAPAGHEPLTVADHDVDRGALRVAPERARDVVEGPPDVVVDAVAAHDRHGVGVVAIHRALVVGEVRGKARARRKARARPTDDLRREPGVVVVLVGDDDELDVLDAQPERVQAFVERGTRLVAQRARVDERQRLAAQHVAADRPDRERRGQLEPVHAVGEHARSVPAARCTTVPPRAARRPVRSPLRRRAAAGPAALRPLGRAPPGGVPRCVPARRHRGRGARRPRRRRLVPRSHVARAHVRARHRADVDGPRALRLRQLRARRRRRGADGLPLRGRLHRRHRRGEPRLGDRPLRRGHRDVAGRAGQGGGDDARLGPPDGPRARSSRRPSSPTSRSTSACSSRGASRSSRPTTTAATRST